MISKFIKRLLCKVYGFDIEELNPYKEVPIRYHSEIGVEPFYASEGAVGMDLVADLGPSDYIELAPNERIKISTGLRIEIPVNMEGRLVARSGLSGDKEALLLNGIGEIDFDYRGILQVPIKNLSTNVLRINNKERIAQLIICRIIKAKMIKVKYADDLSKTVRGDGGFGSTGTSLDCISVRKMDCDESGEKVIREFSQQYNPNKAIEYNLRPNTVVINKIYNKDSDNQIKSMTINHIKKYM